MIFSNPLNDDFFLQKFLPHAMKKSRINDYDLNMVVTGDNDDDYECKSLLQEEKIHPQCSFFLYNNSADASSKIPMLVVCGFEKELVVHVVNKKDGELFGHPLYIPKHIKKGPVTKERKRNIKTNNPKLERKKSRKSISR